MKLMICGFVTNAVNIHINNKLLTL